MSRIASNRKGAATKSIPTQAAQGPSTAWGNLTPEVFVNAAWERNIDPIIIVTAERIELQDLKGGVSRSLPQKAELRLGQTIENIQDNAYQVAWTNSSSFTMKIGCETLKDNTKPSFQEPRFQIISSASITASFRCESRARVSKTVRVRTLGGEAVLLHRGSHMDVGHSPSLDTRRVLRFGHGAAVCFAALHRDVYESLRKLSILGKADGIEVPTNHGITDLTMRTQYSRVGISGQVLSTNAPLTGIGRDCRKIQLRKGARLHYQCSSDIGSLDHFRDERGQSVAFEFATSNASLGVVSKEQDEPKAATAGREDEVVCPECGKDCIEYGASCIFEFINLDGEKR
ncbi:Hypothetical predicted protein [Lecanosticta acicola]|uniref:Uncharacterized protein n=1 Tax=Lecanosticta acicola TaxID=111012 RepID=A0AAI9E960_9PEZI|nr:Hypothetical predicted protein [Lecanosticta acicola]